MDSQPHPTSEVTQHVESILLAHQKALADPARRRTDRGGGVLPVCVDESGCAFALLGEGPSGICSSFGGWIDVGETTAQGCAREFWEESRGTICSLVDAWRAISLEPSFAQLLPSPKRSRFMYVIFLGVLGQAERENVQNKFLRTIAWDSASAEVRSLHFIPLLQLRQHCTEKPGNSVLVDAATSKGLKVRSFLHEWLASELLWSRVQWLSDLAERGVPCCQPLSALPQLVPHEKDWERLRTQASSLPTKTPARFRQ